MNVVLPKTCKQILKLPINKLSRIFVNTYGISSFKLIVLAPLANAQGKYFQRSFCKSLSMYQDTSESNSSKDDEDVRDPTKDRSKIIPIGTSIRYLNSEAYKFTYGDEPVWTKYRRNFKGQFAPKKTRLTCIKDGEIITGNPCPICRDEYLVVDYSNAKLLKQFLSPYTDKVLPWSVTNICQEQHMKIEVAVEKARLHGIISFYVPFREYNYEDYYKKEDS